VPRREMLDAPFANLESDYAHAVDRRHRWQPAGARSARNQNRTRPSKRL
jgi:hypothetical protein